MTARQIPLLLEGSFQNSESSIRQPVRNPATQAVLAEVPFATPGEVDRAVAAAKEAFQELARSSGPCPCSYHAVVSALAQKTS
jgi:acyl-CoA reductase-like NAD-dependent aldehyde dehydrogenase